MKARLLRRTHLIVVAAKSISFCLLMLGLCFTNAVAQDLSHMGIEELISLDITSVSKKKERMAGAAAAITVITNDDIRRSGVTRIWDAFRLAPGVHVAKALSDIPAVTIRGLNDVSNSVLLVLLDGRPYYDPSFSGISWPGKEVVLEDVERIEIIRGPGATMWGVNAVNGVINIITKNAADTQGVLLSGGGGSHELGFGTARYGGEIGDGNFYRAWITGHATDEFEDSQGRGFDDNRWLVQPGFRMDSELNDTDTLQLNGEFAYAEDDLGIVIDPVINDLFGTGTSNSNTHIDTSLMGKWTRELGEESHLQLMSYYVYTSREIQGADPERHSIAFSAEHRLPLGERHDILWGGEYRAHWDDWGNSPITSLEPETDNYDFVSGLLQDEIEITEEVSLILGAKLSHNDFTGYEFQPTGRVAWAPSSDTTLWGAVSRSVRTPGRSDRDLRLLIDPIPGDPPTIPVVTGNPGVDGMDQMAYEAGIRSKLADNLFVDVAGFFFRYTDVFSGELQDPQFIQDGGRTRIEVPLIAENNLTAESWGAEVALDYRPVEAWRLVGSYSYIDMSIFGSNTDDNCSGAPGATPFQCLRAESLPNNMFSIRSNLNLPENISFDTFLQYVQSFDALVAPPDGYEIDNHVILDLRLAWAPCEGLELAVVGQNLVEDGHTEWAGGGGPTSANAGYVPRSVYGKVTWEFMP